MSKGLGAYGPPSATRPSKGYESYDDRYGYSDYSSKPKGFSKGERPERSRRPPPDSGTDFVRFAFNCLEEKC